MTAVTAFGCEISVRCDPPWNMVMCECARWAIASSEAGVMIWSPVLMKYQDGIVFQAAAFDGVPKADVAAPRWDAHSLSASLRGRSWAKLWMKMFSFRYSSDAPVGAFGEAVVSNSCDGVFVVSTEPAPESWPVVWPGAGAAAST